MATDQTSRAVIAMRIRLGLLRLNVAIDATQMVNDAAYAATVLQQCRQSGSPELARLADRFEFGGQDSQLSLPPNTQPADEGPGHSRVDSGFAASSRFAPGGGAATRPAADSQSAPTTLQPGASGHTGSSGEGGDPNDPNHPRNRRYLRGAR